MNKMKLLSLALACVTCASIGGTALAASDATKAVPAPTTTVEKEVELSPREFGSKLETQANDMAAMIEDILAPNASDSDELEYQMENFYDILDDAFAAIRVIANVDDDPTVPFVRDTYAKKIEYIPFSLQEKIFTLNNIDQIVIRYEIAPKKEGDSTTWAKIAYFRHQNRLRLDYGTAENTYDISGTDVVYRNGRFFIQTGWMQQPRREFAGIPTFWVARMMLTPKTVYMTDTFIPLARFKEIRLSGGSPGWNTFKFKTDVVFQFVNEKLTLLSPSGKVLETYK